jgi:hypothetical protein
LRDWQRWSGRQAREQLVAEAQALATAAAGKIAVKAHAETIEKLRERWKELDKLGGPTNQTSWLAFDGALKTAYAPVAAHLEKLKAAREENLAARNTIIEGLNQAATRFFPAVVENAAQAAEAKTDWRAVSHTLEEARVAWRRLGPVEHTVPRKALQGQNSVTTRYDAAIQSLLAPLKNAYGEATRQREALISAAKDLVTPEGVVREAVAKVRKLQTDWQAHAKALPLPRHEENALWIAFKSATDAVFTGLDASRAAREAEFGAKTRAREEIIERVTACASANVASEIKRALAEADSAWRACPQLPKPQGEKYEKRYRGARAAATKRIGELAAHAARARFDALVQAMALCQERETSSEPAPDLEARWNAVEHLPTSWKTKLQARFLGGQADSAVRLPEALLDLEIACGIDSPPEFEADRQRLKLRALKEAMESRRGPATTQDDIERRLIDAAAMPRPDVLSRERLARIIAAVQRAQRR